MYENKLHKKQNKERKKSEMENTQREGERERGERAGELKGRRKTEKNERKKRKGADMKIWGSKREYGRINEKKNIEKENRAIERGWTKGRKEGEGKQKKEKREW